MYRQPISVQIVSSIFVVIGFHFTLRNQLEHCREMEKCSWNKDKLSYNVIVDLFIVKLLNLTYLDLVINEYIFFCSLNSQNFHLSILSE